ncbi:MAG TPA: GNAT family N-acetyltransferase, partial [Acetobacteraceae bacterium]|nr:GNAT family N-acetyltransferase [Acetobacteraceae bacterium]
NAGSIGVHASLGFHMVGTMRAVGLKFGRWLDVVTMQRAIGRGAADVPSGGSAV